MDQCLFAAPHGFSQRTTSFIASQRQGIHRIPLRHLIALIVDAHRLERRRPATMNIREKTSLLRGPFDGSAVKPCQSDRPGAPAGGPGRSNEPSFHDVRQHALQHERQRRSRRKRETRIFPDKRAAWWSQTGSNRRPHACKARALPTELWPRRGERETGGPGKT